MTKELAKLFGSMTRIKIIRYFLSHQNDNVFIDDLQDKLKVDKDDIQSELLLLKNIDLVSEAWFDIEYEDGEKQRQVKGYSLNKNFSYLSGLEALLLDFRFIDKKILIENFKKYGRIKLISLSGVFMFLENLKLDMMIVGDVLDKNGMEKYIKVLEAELGKELSYAIFETEEFEYRLKMQDGFIRVFLKGPHEHILEKISTRV
jgi:hypothetical protein